MGNRANAVFMKMEILHTVSSSDSATQEIELSCRGNRSEPLWLSIWRYVRECAAVILESPLMSAGKIAGTVLPFLGPLLVRGYDT
ncbi:MAG: hypothetical protein WB992_15095 [Bryobacteraceae bacterium]